MVLEGIDKIVNRVHGVVQEQDSKGEAIEENREEEGMQKEKRVNGDVHVFDFGAIDEEDSEDEKSKEVAE